MTIKEAVRSSIYNFLNEDECSSVVDNFVKNDKKKRKQDKEDISDTPIRGDGEIDPYTKFKKRYKGGKVNEEVDMGQVPCASERRSSCPNVPKEVTSRISKLRKMIGDYDDEGKDISKLQQELTSLKRKYYGMNESYRRLNEETFINNQNYSHFAVNKQTNKIVNGWDYHDIDPSELKEFKRDYFIVDLLDYDLDPKQYKILGEKYLLRIGIDPNDNNNWANS